MKYTTTALTHGAMTIALNLLAVTIDRMLGGMSELMMLLLLAYPMMFYALKHTLAQSAGVYIANGIACLFFATPSMLIYALIANLLGIWYGYGIKKQWKNEWLIGGNVILMSACYMVTTVLLASFFGYDVAAELEVLSEMLQGFSLAIDSDTLLGIYLASTLLLSLMQSFALHMGAHLLLKRFNLNLLHMHSMLEWRLHPAIAWLFLFVLVVYVGGSVVQYPHIIQMIVLMLLCVGRMVCAVYGALRLLILLPIARKRVLMLILLLAAILPLSGDLLALIGLLDAWFDFCKRLR